MYEMRWGRETGRVFIFRAFHRRVVVLVVLLSLEIHHDGRMVIAGILSGVVNELQKLPGPLVYVVVFLLVFGESALFIGFILPAEAAVLVGGAIASQGHVSIRWLCLGVVLSAILGDSVGYFVGERWGHHLLKLPIVRRRHVAITRVLEGLKRRGPIYVFVGRFTAFLRAVMPGLAGMSKMHYPRFLMANAAGGLTWGLGFTLLGYFAGATLKKVEKYASWGGIGLLFFGCSVALALHVFKQRRERAEELAWRDAHPGEERQEERS